MLKKVKSWFVGDSGAMAVEFAMVAFPFFIMLMGTIEVSLSFATSFMLEGGTTEAARLIRTGEAKDSGNPEVAFRTLLCDEVSFLIPCGDIIYESIVLAPGEFASAASYTPVFDADGNLVPAGFSEGVSGDIVLVRAFYRYEFLFPFIGNIMTGGLGGNSVPLMSTAVIKNEPYSF